MSDPLDTALEAAADLQQQRQKAIKALRDEMTVAAHEAFTALLDECQAAGTLDRALRDLEIARRREMAA